MSTGSGGSTSEPTPAEGHAKDTSPGGNRKFRFDALWAGIRAIQARKRIAHLMSSLDPMERSPCVMIMRRSESGRRTGPPEVKTFRGLRAIVEVSAPSGEIHWHFFWATKRAAEHYEAQMARYDSSGEVVQEVIRWIELPRRSIWRRTASLGAAFGILASLAVILTNLDAVNASLIRMFHRPVMTLDGGGALRVDSTAQETRQITILGDPFVRSRLSNLTMRLVPQDRRQGSFSAKSLPAKRVLGADRPVGAGQHLILELPFDKVPPGHYLVRLNGEVRTAWPWNSTSFSQLLPLESLRSLEVQTSVAILVPQSPPGPGAESAFIDLHVLTARIRKNYFNVNVDIVGDWVGGSVVGMYLPSGVTSKQVSRNSTGDPKDFVFTLEHNSIGSFSEESARILLESKVPMTLSQWRRAVAPAHVHLAF